MSHFCTCTDRACPLNPANHSKGCDLCIQKCLKQGEIPSCFFRAVGGGARPEAYTYQGFARFVETHKDVLSPIPQAPSE